MPIARALLVPLVLFSLIARAETHGAAGENDPTGDSGESAAPSSDSTSSGSSAGGEGGGSLVLPGKGSRAGKTAPGKGEGKRAGKKDGGGDGNDAPSSGDSKTATDDKQKMPSSYPLFIVGVGPTRKDSKDDAEGRDFLVSFTDIVQKAVPGARVLAVRPLTLASLQTAWKDGVKKGLVSRAPVSALLIIHTGTVVGYHGDLSLMTEAGNVTEAQFESSIAALDESIFGKKPDSFEKRARLNTAMLTSYAGRLDCTKFPAPLFGITSDNQKWNLEAMPQWLPRLKKRLDFPMDAKGWFEAWELATRLDADRGFLCPAKAPKGYLGEKNTAKKDSF